MARAASVLGALTLVSRVTGLLRDVVIGALFGASASADAFFVAFRIPNLFRRVVAEGASSTAIVPVLTAYREREGSAAALTGAGALGLAAAWVLGAVSLLGAAFARPVVTAVAPGFCADDAQRALTVALTAMLFPYVGLVGMAGWAMGVLHTFRRFVTPAYGPILFNLAVVASAAVLSPLLSVPVHALGLGVLIGGALHFAVQLPALRLLGMRREHLVASHPAVRRVGRLLVPALAGGAAYQVNILVGTLLASILPARSVSYLWYADRLFEFPLGLIAVTVGTAVLPSFASHANASRYEELSFAAGHALRLVWALCIPATVGLWILAPSLVSALFQHGEFLANDAAMTANALRAFVIGLLGVASAHVLVSVFYALERPGVAVVTGGVALLVNAGCGLMTMGPVAAGPSTVSRMVAQLSAGMSVADWDHVGLAFATSMAATVQAGLLLVFTRSALGCFMVRSIGGSLARHCAASAFMGVVVCGWLRAVAYLELAEPQYLEVVGGLLLGGTAFLAAALALGSEEVRDLLGSLRSR